jgi:hypothetical protein
MNNYSQYSLINKINEFLSAQLANKKILSKEEQGLIYYYENSKGVCAGLSSLESLEHRRTEKKKNDTNNFWANYTKIIEWKKETNLSEDETSKLIAFIKNIQFYQNKQCIPDKIYLDKKSSYTLDLSGNKFIQIKSLENYVVDKDILAMIVEGLLKPKTILFIGGRSDDGNHITNICLDAEGKISFYDPNSSDGSVAIKTTETLCNKLFSALDPSKFREAMSGMHLTDLCLRKITINVYQHEEDVSYSGSSKINFNISDDYILSLIEKYSNFLSDSDHHIHKKLQENLSTISPEKLLSLYTQQPKLQNFLSVSIDKIKNNYITKLKEVASSSVALAEVDQSTIESLTAEGLKLGSLLNYFEASMLLKINPGKTELVNEVYTKVTNFKGKEYCALLPLIENVKAGHIDTAKQIILNAFKCFKSLPTKEAIIEWIGNMEIAKYLCDGIWMDGEKTAKYSFSELELGINQEIKNNYITKLKEVASSSVALAEVDQSTIESLTAEGLKLGSLLNYFEASMLLKINPGKTELVNEVYTKVTNFKGKEYCALLPLIENVKAGHIDTAKQIILNAFKCFKSLPTKEAIIEWIGNMEIAKYLCDGIWMDGEKTAKYSFSELELGINQEIKNNYVTEGSSEEVVHIGEAN